VRTVVKYSLLKKLIEFTGSAVEIQHGDIDNRFC